MSVIAIHAHIDVAQGGLQCMPGESGRIKYLDEGNGLVLSTYQLARNVDGHERRILLAAVTVGVEQIAL